MIRVPGSLIVVGNRLIFDVYDESGRIMLVRGTPIGTPEIASMIRKSGFRIPPSRKAGAVFRDMTSIAERLEIIEEDIRMSRDGGAWIRRIENLVKDFIQMSDVDPNAALGAIHLDHQHSYLVVHSLMVALVASRLALALDADPVTRHSIVGAGMTHDLALAPIRYAIDASPSLKENYQEQIRQHPERTVSMLRDFGLADPLWLEAIADHHERLDGSGYHGKKGDQLGVAARILAIADAYSAMLRSRPYRERMTAGDAIETLFSEQGQHYDASIIEALVWDFGFRPPGSVLRLANGEVAVAVRSTPGLLDSPLVASILAADGTECSEPIFRDTRDPEFEIMDVLDPDCLDGHESIVEAAF